MFCNPVKCNVTYDILLVGAIWTLFEAQHGAGFFMINVFENAELQFSSLFDTDI